MVHFNTIKKWSRGFPSDIIRGYREKACVSSSTLALLKSTYTLEHRENGNCAIQLARKICLEESGMGIVDGFHGRLLFL